MEVSSLKIEKLRDKDNWHQWRFIIRTLLENEDDLLDVCEGKLIKPADSIQDRDAKFKRFEKADKAARKLIVTTVEKKPLDLLLNCTTAKDMWTKLNSVYDMKSNETLSLIQKQFFECKWESSESVAHNLSKLENIVTKMKSLGGGIPDSMMLTRVLCILPTKFNHFHSAWDSVDEQKKTLENLTTRLMAEELRIQRQEASSESTVALFTNSRQRNTVNNRYDRRGQDEYVRSNKQISCYTCGRRDHLKKDCPGCYSCGSKNHLSKNCPKKGRRLAKLDGGSSSQQHTHTRQAFVGVNGIITGDGWLIDSGASDHMSHRRDWFHSFEEFESPVKIKVGNGEEICAYGKGNIEIETFVNSDWIPGTMYGVLYVPCLKQNLFSVKVVAKKGVNFSITNCGKHCSFTRNNNVIATGSDSGNLYKLDARVVKPKECYVVNKVDTLQLWHERLCHQNKRHVKSFLGNIGINLVVDNDFCEGCAYGKMHKLTFHERMERATEVREVIHTDVCGPMQIESLGKKRYSLIFKDEYSGFRNIYFLREKSEVCEKLELFCGEIKNQFGRDIKELHSDGGKEYMNKRVENLLNSRGIKHSVNIAYTPQQNGVAERDNRIITEAARSMIYSNSNLPLSVWAEAMNTAVYVINRTGPSKQAGKTPYDLWYGKTANVNNLKVFGTECFIHIPGEKRKKLDKKAIKGFFVGYVDNCKGFRVYIPSLRDVVLSRDVLFKKEKLIASEISVEIQNASTSKDDLVIETDEDSFASAEDDAADNQTENIESLSIDNSSLTRELRDRRMIRPTDFYGCSITYFAERLPTSYKDAIKSKENYKWRAAMQSEIDSLRENQTWVLVEKPENQTIINNRWVYTKKLNSDGTERYKARLVIKGYNQVEGLDYKETFSPVVRYDTIRILLSIAARDALCLAQFDIKTAFLYGKLTENIYMKQPEGFDDGTSRVCKLQKSLYGLKQAPRCWTEHFSKFLKVFGFQQSTADPCFYIYSMNSEKLLLAIYVDDGLLAATREFLLDKFLYELNQRFKATATKNVNSFLGIEINRLSDGSIFVSQCKYVTKILGKFKLDNANSVSTPIDTGWESNSSEEENCNVPYREAVGNLMFLQVVSRPDIGYAVNITARALENPSKEHWLLIKRILRYLIGSKDVGLLYCRTGNFEAYSDADFAGDKRDRKSTSGIVCKYANAAVIWQSKRQQSVALSTTEAEYVSAASAVKEIIWLKKLLTEYGNKENYVLYIDNMSAIKLIKNPEFHQRSKHIDVKYHFVRDLYKNGEINVKYIRTEEQIADVFTKALAKPRFLELRSKLGLRNKSELEIKIPETICN